jgi:hypothetical protein
MDITMNYPPALRGLIATAACAVCPGAIRAAAAPGINPTADTFVSSANPGDNYGAAGALEVSAVSSAKGEFDSFLRFNLGSTLTYFNGVYGTGNWTVQSITLTLNSTPANNAIFNSSVAGMFSVQLNDSDTWVEGTGTPSAPDTTATDLNYTNHTNYESPSDPLLGTFTFPGGTSGANIYSLTLSSGLLSDVQNGSDASMYVSAADTAVSYLFNSTNFGTAADRPLLVVNAVPEPAAPAILCGAMGLLAFGYVRGERRV